MSVVGYFQVKSFDLWVVDSFPKCNKCFFYILFYNCIMLIKYYMNIKVKRFTLLF